MTARETLVKTIESREASLRITQANLAAQEKLLAKLRDELKGLDD